MVTRIQALRMAAANKLRKRIDYDLSCRLSPEGDLTAWRRATPEERRVCGRRVRLGLKNGASVTKTEFVHRSGDHWVDEDGRYHIVAFPGGG